MTYFYEFFNRIDGIDGHGLLTIDDATKGLHDAWFTATAVNKGGRDLTRCKVTVEQADDGPEEQRRIRFPKSTKLADMHGSHADHVGDLRKVNILLNVAFSP